MQKIVKPALLLTFALVLSACQSPPVAPQPVKPPQIPALPPELGPKVREPNLTDRLLKLLSPSPSTATTPSVSETPASSNTTPSERR